MDLTNTSRKLWEICTKSPVATTTLAALGGVWTSYQLYKLASFTHLHFLHRSSLVRYKNKTGTSAAWALVTGASDGIGKAFAEELCHRGFNVVLHGRNEKKLNGVRDELLEQWPSREIRILVLDAAEGASQPARIEAAVRQLEDLNIKLLINNVAAAATKPIWIPMAEYDEERSRLALDMTSRFSIELTRLLLPRFIKDSPALVIDIGSFISELPAPYISIFGAAKAMNKAWYRSMAFEMKVEGHDVEFMHVLVGIVATPRENRKVTFMVPSSRTLAKATLDKVGCGRSAVFGYWAHGMQCFLMTNLPAWAMETMLMRMVKEEKEKEDKELKAR